MKLRKREKPIPEVEALGSAWRDFWLAVIEASGIERALDWLAARLEKKP